MTRTHILLLTGAALTTAGVILFRRWNRQLEAACALPVYRRHPSIPGSLRRLPPMRHARGGEVRQWDHDDSIPAILHPGYYVPSDEEVRRGLDVLLQQVHAENERQAGRDFFKRWVDPR